MDAPLTQPDRYQMLIDALQAGGYRLTPQRLAICRHLAASRAHPSPGQVYEQVHREQPAISLATVYNTLEVLRDLGEIIEMPGGAEGVRFETDLSPHANLICMRCGRIVDLPLNCLDMAEAAIREVTDFDLHRLRVDGFGLCAGCRSQALLTTALTAVREEEDHART
jgi:Fur family peroxide stress response transcriptional regulator